MEETNEYRKFYGPSVGSGYLPGQCFVCGTPVGGNHLARYLIADTLSEEDAAAVVKMFDGKAQVQVLPFLNAKATKTRRTSIRVCACDKHPLAVNHLSYHVVRADQSISRELVQRVGAAQGEPPLIHEALEAVEGQWVGVLTSKNQRLFGRLSNRHPYGERRVAIFPVEGPTVYPYRDEIEELRRLDDSDVPRTLHRESKESTEPGDLEWVEAEAEMLAALGRLYFTRNTTWGEATMHTALRVGLLLVRDMRRILTMAKRS